MANNIEKQLKEISERLEQGVKEIFTSERYTCLLYTSMGKNVDSYGNALVTSTYGTQRANAYRLLEDALTLRDTKIYDTVQDAEEEHRELNRKETMLAQQKQELIKEEFKEWILKTCTDGKISVRFIMNDLTASVHGNMMEAIFSLSA